MLASDLRIALITGNYHMVRDGPTQALNRLVGYLLRQGAKVRIFAPTTRHPQVEPTGDLVIVPSIAIPGRSEYQFPLGLYGNAWNKFAEFEPNMIHVASPDFAARQAAKWGRDHGVPVLATVHTRFETYPAYYGAPFLRPPVERWLRTFYRRADALMAPAESMRQVLFEQGMSAEIGIWARGVDRELFNPARRSLEWRRRHGIADDEVAIGFLGRVVMEKGLDVFANTIALMEKRKVKFRVLVIGDGPARPWFEGKLPADTAFSGVLHPPEIGTAVASMDVLFNPSATETFGNVTLEAMACGHPVVAAQATGSDSLVVDGVTGALIKPNSIRDFARTLQAYVEQPELRAAHGAAGERRSLEFDWDRINQGMLDTYLRLVGQRRAQASY
ncbi:MAG: glycosyltransferase family 1 protein [Novosphingobium sp.]|nr:glycosyltransferase family 1 protein [Novosphingobium sp.]